MSLPAKSSSRGWWGSFLDFLGASLPEQLNDFPNIVVSPQYVVDIHAHASMKLNIWGKKFWGKHSPVPGDGLLSMLGVQVDYQQLKCGRVGVIIVPHDIPVGAMRRKFGMLSRVIRFLNRFANKMEHEDFSNFTQINKIINLFEEQIYITNRKLGCETFVIARSYAELVEARKRGKIVFIHAIEGSHALGRNIPPSPEQIPRKLRKGHKPVRDGMMPGGTFLRYLNNIESLKSRGVCMLTLAYLFENELFMKNFYREIDNMVILAKKQGKRLALRLNGTSDLDWIDVYKKYPDIQFYEYTKRPDMVKKTANIENVHMTFSRTEKTKDTTVQKMLLKGVNVAVVFDDKREIPLKYYNVNVIDGDKHDRRFEDSQGSVVGLKLKGTNKTKALARATGFAV